MTAAATSGKYPVAAAQQSSKQHGLSPLRALNESLQVGFVISTQTDLSITLTGWKTHLCDPLHFPTKRSLICLNRAASDEAMTSNGITFIISLLFYDIFSVSANCNCFATLPKVIVMTFASLLSPFKLCLRVCFS